MLGLVVAELLYEHFPEVDEGQLSRCRARLVKGEALARLAKEKLHVQTYILLGKSEKKTAQNSTLANVTEALIGAIYLDAGKNMDQVKTVIRELYQNEINALDINTLEKDPKSMLQELCQARQVDLPCYALVYEEGKSHHKTFTISCTTTLSEKSCSARENSIKKGAVIFIPCIENTLIEIRTNIYLSL